MKTPSSPNDGNAAEPVVSQILYAPAPARTTDDTTAERISGSADAAAASQLSPSAPASDTAWIEKAAQQRFDRMYAVTSAGTRTALTWLTFLVIIWLQSIQPKLAKLDDLSNQREKVAAKIGRIVGPGATLLGGDREKYIKLSNLDQSLQTSLQTEVGEAIELPFGIKLKSIPPIVVPLLWSGLMLGLLSYLLSVRRQALTLAGRAVRLLCYQADLPKERLSDISLGAAWWLAPLPTRDGSLVKPLDLWHLLGWSKIRKRALYTAMCVFLLLTLLEGAVLYASFILAQTVRQQHRDMPNRHEIGSIVKPDGNPPSTLARKRSFFDESTLLVLATLLSGGCYLVIVFKWFWPSRVPDSFAEEDPVREDTRRRVLAGLVQGAIVVVTSGYGFSLARRRRPHWQTSAIYLADKNNPRVPRFRWKKHKHRRTTPDELPAPGIYQNPKSFVFHVVAGGCKHKSGGTFHLKEMKSTSVEQLEKGLSSNAAMTGRSTFSPQRAGRVAGLIRQRHLGIHESDVSQLESLALLLLARHTDPTLLARLTRLKPVDGAIQLLRLGMEGMPKSIRLYDLLAAIAVRYKRNDLLDWVVSRAQILGQIVEHPDKKTASKKQRRRKKRTVARDYAPTAKGTTPSGMLSVDWRIKKWKDRNGTWYKRWSNTATPAKWARQNFDA